MKKKFFLFFFIAIHVSAQQTRFEHFFLEDGLSQSYVSDIKQDKFGYLWVATHDGLNRYDGYNFKIFRHIPEDTNSIKGNWINQIFTDSKGRIWIKLGIGGLDVFLPKTNKFIHLNDDGPQPLAHKLINYITEDQYGRIIITTPAGISIISDSDDGSFIIKTIRIENYYKNAPAITNNFIRCTVDGQNSLWALAASGSLLRFNLNEENYREPEFYNNTSDQAGDDHVTSIFLDNSGFIWSGNDNGLITKYTIKSAQNIAKHILNTKDHSSVKSFFEIDNSVYYLSESDKLYKLNDKKAYLSATIPSGINSLFTDNQENIWITTTQNNLLQVNKSGRINVFTTDEINPGLKNFGLLTKVFVDASKNVWIGYFERNLKSVRGIQDNQLRQECHVYS